jgi:hypothetical protein
MNKFRVSLGYKITVKTAVKTSHLLITFQLQRFPRLRTFRLLPDRRPIVRIAANPRVLRARLSRRATEASVGLRIEGVWSSARVLGVWAGEFRVGFVLVAVDKVHVAWQNSQ